MIFSFFIEEKGKGCRKRNEKKKKKENTTHHKLHSSIPPCWDMMIVQILVALRLLLRLFLGGDVGQDAYFDYYQRCGAYLMVSVVDGILTC